MRFGCQEHQEPKRMQNRIIFEIPSHFSISLDKKSYFKSISFWKTKSQVPGESNINATESCLTGKKLTDDNMNEMDGFSEEILNKAIQMVPYNDK